MYLCFTLTMPGVKTWNNRWSDADKLYARVCNMGTGKDSVEQAERILAHTPYSYNFGDGWVAQIDVRAVGTKEIRKIRTKSRGFCNYDWMIDEIIMHQEIRKPIGAST